jgi:hypothetical protein
MRRISGVALNCILTIALALTLSIRSEAQSQSGNLDFTGYKVAIVIGAVAVVAIVVAVAVHKSSGKRTITGCVKSADSGMILTDEKDKRLYALSGGTGIIAGDRMTLQVKKIKPKDAGGSAAWRMTKIDKDFGVCPN